jgi:hypothetical protein
MQIELTKEQAQTLLQLLDIAVKAGGLQVAKPAYDIATVVQESINQEESK